MKIDITSVKAPPLRNTPQTTAKPAEAATRNAEAVSLSQTAATLQGSERPPVDAARIQEIKTAIAEGRFKINPEAIAEGLIESARELVNRQRQA